MNTIHEKPVLGEFAVARAAQELRAKAPGALIARAAGGIKSFVKRRIVDPLVARAQRQHQLEELLNMDDHMLRDLGLSRGGITYAFKHGRDAEPANTNTPLSKPRAA